MPEFEAYAITLTFRPQIKYIVRMTRIALFRKIIRDAFKNICDYHLQYSLEYHKYPVTHPFAGQPNPHAPHVHAYLEVYDCEVPQRTIDKIVGEFCRKFGRTQFDQLHSKEDMLRWVEYIQKDVTDNNQRYPSIQHHKEINHKLTDYQQLMLQIDPEHPYLSDDSEN